MEPCGQKSCQQNKRMIRFGLRRISEYDEFGQQTGYSENWWHGSEVVVLE
jgi:hypothetical protein